MCLYVFGLIKENMKLSRSKGGIFQKVRFVFQISKSPQNIFQITILGLKFEFIVLLLLAGNLNFKLRIGFSNIFFFGGLEI